MSSMKAMAQQLINELDELLQFITQYEESDRYIPFDYRHMHPLKLTYEVLKLVSRNLKVRQNCPYYLNPVDNKIQEDEVEEANQFLWDCQHPL
ncbi:MAG: hypothetical protein ACK4M7_00460 [Burkholderiales bacterium]